MSKEMASLLIGIGVEIIVTIFEVVVRTMPMQLTITFGVIGLALIVYGLVSLIRRKGKDSGAPQSVSQSKAGRDILQAGRDINLTQVELDNIALEFSVKIETMQSKGQPIYLDRTPDIQQSPPWLSINISFRTNQVIQIASLYLQIDPVDPRDIIEPDPDLAQGFSLPHILQRSETHQFQFRISPSQAKGDHSLLLKVLAGGKWYTDGPYTIGLSGS